MGFTPDRERAREVLFEEAEKLERGVEPPEAWVERIEQLSQLCEASASTHIAFLGTSILAKAVNDNADVFAVKKGAGTEWAFSARGLGHNVLVPAAPELEIDIGSSGREPLNNQPYFRISRATEDVLLDIVRDPAPVRALVEILSELETCTASEARDALQAYIKVRREYVPEYPTVTDPASPVPVNEVSELIDSFVSERSEGGKRAQAAAAGLMDAVYGSKRVEAGRINDPDRHLPGDVGIEAREGVDEWARVLEVRDKSVSRSDAIKAIQKAATEGVPLLAIVAIAEGQEELPELELIDWGRERGVELVIYEAWEPLVVDAFFWGPGDLGETVVSSLRRVGERLKEVEASVESVEVWMDRVRDMT